MEAYFLEESKRFKILIDNLISQKVAIIGHVRPDGDCIGSQLALCKILRDRGCDAVCVNHHPVPYNLKSFVKNIPFIEEPNFKNTENRIVVAVDCGNKIRLGAHLLESEFQNRVYAAIDHHETNEFFGEVENIVCPETAATCYLLATFCINCGISFDKDLAEMLYIGILTDTGKFQYSTTTAHVMEVVSELVRAGVRPDAISAEIYEQERFGKLILLQRYLSTMELLSDGKFIVAYIPKTAFEETGTTREDADSFVDYIRNVGGVKIACQLEQSHTGIKGSLRTADEKYRVDILAKRLNGGGHRRAAGFNLDGMDIDKDIPYVKKMVLDYILECEGR